MNIPDTEVRKAFIALISGLNIPVFDEVVPKNIDIPPTRVLLSTQTDSQVSTNKCGHLWNHTLLIDIVSECPQGFSNKSVVDGIYNSINNLVDLASGDISLNGFVVYNTQLQNSHDMYWNGPSISTNRKLVRYQFVIGASQ
jgi:hypothetical protein